MSNKRLPNISCDKTFFIADTHFGHTKSIQMCGRPFHTCYEMDATMINNWNKVVDNNSIVYFLGDLSFHSRPFTERIINELKGTKIMILGNHDGRGRDFYNQFFKFVVPAPMLLPGTDIILSHEPIVDCPLFNIYGHVHEKPEWPKISITGACVSVEKINYTPISLSEILTLRSKLIDEIHKV